MAGETWALTVPLMLKVYVREPAERKLVPVVRVGAAYHRFSGSVSEGVIDPSSFETHDLELVGSVGVIYFVTSQLGLGIDAGIAYERRLASEGAYFPESAWSVSASWRASLVLRL